MTPRERLVVVGHGMAGTRLVEELVRRGGGYEITVIGDEPDPGYNRVLLSAVVGGSHGVDDVLLRDAAWYAERGVRVASGRRVTQINREHRQAKRNPPPRPKSKRGRHFQRAGDRTRTGDVQLGKLAFYH